MHLMLLLVMSVGVGSSSPHRAWSFGKLKELRVGVCKEQYTASGFDGIVNAPMLRRLAELIAGDRRLVFCQHGADESCDQWSDDQCVRSSPECQALALTPPHLMLCQVDGIEPNMHILHQHLWNDLLMKQDQPPYFPFKDDVWSENLYWTLKERSIWKEGTAPFHLNWNMEPSFQNPVPGRGVLINDIRTPPHDEEHEISCNGFTGGPKGPLGNTVYVAEAAFGFLGRTHKPESLLKIGIDASAELRRKTHFAAYMHKHCHGHCIEERVRGRGCLAPAAIVREAFYELLAEAYKRPHALGVCMAKHNTPQMRDEANEIMRTGKAKGVNSAVNVGAKGNVNLLRSFKFVLAFENSDCPGAMSEKAVNAALANAVPIMWGARDVSSLVSMEAVIYCNLTFDVHHPTLQETRVHTEPTMGVAGVEQRWKEVFSPSFGYPFSPAEEEEVQELVDRRFARVKAYLRRQPGFDKCIARIKEVDDDDAEFKRMISAPFTSTGKIVGDPVFDLDMAVARKVRAVMEATEVSNWGKQRGSSPIGTAPGSSHRASSLQTTSISSAPQSNSHGGHGAGEEEQPQLRRRGRGRGRKGARSRSRSRGGDRKKRARRKLRSPAAGGLGKHRRRPRLE
jgi:hypothetical protein